MHFTDYFAWSEGDTCDTSHKSIPITCCLNVNKHDPTFIEFI